MLHRTLKFRPAAWNRPFDSHPSWTKSRRLPVCAALLTVLVGLAGCQSFSSNRQAGLLSNPLILPARNDEIAWERTVEVLHDYQFQIARENKLDGVIETDYKIGAGLLEPWHRDAVGFENRLEGSLQSVRRRAFVSLSRSPDGYAVGVEVFKEQEDLEGLAANSPGGATFQESAPLDRDLNQVIGQSKRSGWIPLGRDPQLEQAILASLHRRFVRPTNP